MSDDLIKRSDAIKALRKLGHEVVVIDKVCSLGVAQEFIDAIRELPSADRPPGEWIFKPLFPNDESEFPMGHLECSVCGSHHRNSTPCNYCDNCGARMKGADDD